MVKRSQEANFFKIGLFVIVGIALVVVAVVLFTTANLFQSRIMVETYFNESVQGLEVGSPVKFNGISVGHVTDIRFVNNVYPVSSSSSTYSRYIYVLLSINPRFLNLQHDTDIGNAISRDVADGLRVKLAMRDLTGNLYLSMDFEGPGLKSKLLPFDWKPYHVYIPSEQSVLTKLTDSVQNILQGLQGVDFKQLFGNVQTLAKTTDNTMQKIDRLVTSTSSSLDSFSKNASTISSNMVGFTEKVKNNPSSLLFGQPKPLNPRDIR